jgi:hypothetical protein
MIFGINKYSLVNNIMPEVVTILTVIIVSVLAIERIVSRIKESKCSNCVEVRFKDSKSKDNLPELLQRDI